MNKVVLIGRLTADVNIRDFEKGTSVARFTLAVPDGKDSEGKDKTQFIGCVAWNNLANVLFEYTHKGDRIGVTGKLVQNVFEKDNVMHYNTDCLIDGVEFLEPKREEKEEKEEKPVTTNRRARR